MEKMPTLISLNLQVYQSTDSVRVHYFLDLSLSYFYRVKGMSWITVEHWQWTIYVKTKRHVYMYIKKASKKLSRSSNPSGKWRSLSFIFVFYPLSCTCCRYPNTAVAVQGHFKCRFFNIHQSLWSPKVIRILMIMKIISFTLNQSGWMESKPNIEN